MPEFFAVLNVPSALINPENNVEKAPVNRVLRSEIRPRMERRNDKSLVCWDADNGILLIVFTCFTVNSPAH